jgi:uncharacterized membrane protein
MKAYIIVTGLIFGLIALVHTARFFMQHGGHAFSVDPWFAWGNVAGIIVAAVIAVWAGWLLFRPRPSSEH